MSDFLVQFQHQHLLSDLPRQRWTTVGKQTMCLLFVRMRLSFCWSDRVVTSGMARGVLVASQTCPTGFAKTKNVPAGLPPSLTPSSLNPQIIIEEKWEGRGRARPGG